MIQSQIMLPIQETKIGPGAWVAHVTLVPGCSGEGTTAKAARAAVRERFFAMLRRWIDADSMLRFTVMTREGAGEQALRLLPEIRQLLYTWVTKPDWSIDAAQMQGKIDRLLASTPATEEASS